MHRVRVGAPAASLEDDLIRQLGQGQPLDLRGDARSGYHAAIRHSAKHLKEMFSEDDHLSLPRLCGAVDAYRDMTECTNADTCSELMVERFMARLVRPVFHQSFVAG